MSDPVTPKRPGIREESVVRAVAIKLTEDLAYETPPLPEDVEDYEEIDDDDYPEFKDIYDTLRDSYDWDGYQLAQHLDHSHCWDVDTQTVEAMDNAVVYRSTVHQRLVQEWVTENNLKPKYVLGDRVRVLIDRANTNIGTITDVRNDMLVYVVSIPELGHTDLAATLEDPIRVRGLVVAEEDILEKLPPKTVPQPFIAPDTEKPKYKDDFEELDAYYSKKQ